MDPDEILPMHLWKGVLDYLGCWRYKVNLITCHSQLEEWFCKEKTKLQLPVALLNVIWNLRDTEDKLLQSAFLNLRLVSSECSAQVSRLIEICWNRNMFLPEFICSSFKTRERAEEFLTEMDSNNFPLATRNPVPSGSVSICASAPILSSSSDPSSQEEPTFAQAVQLCNRIRRNIRELDLEVKVKSMNGQAVARKDQEGKFVADVLMQFVDLKRFCISIETDDDNNSSDDGDSSDDDNSYDEDNFSDEEYCSDDDISSGHDVSPDEVSSGHDASPDEEKQDVPSTPSEEVEAESNESLVELPSLPKLTDLFISGDSHTLYKQCRIELSFYFPQITFLVINFSHWKNEYNDTGLFPKLRYLSIVDIPILIPQARTKLINILQSRYWPRLQCMILNLSDQGTDNGDEKDEEILAQHRKNLEDLEAQLVSITLKELECIRDGSRWTNEREMSKGNLFVFEDEAYPFN